MRPIERNPRATAVARAYRRGTASLEAVSALPALILILFGVLYVSRSITSRHQADDLARSCAWRYSANGCSEVPDGCGKRVVRVTRGGAGAEALESALGEAMDIEALFAAKEAGFEGIIASIMGAAFGDSVMRSLVKDARGAVTYRVSREGLGEGREESVAAYQLPCNLKKRTVKQVALDTWKSAISSRY